MAEGGAPGALERVVSEDSFIRRQFRQNKNFKKQDKQRKEDQGLYTSHIDDAMIQDVEITTSDVLKVKSSSPSIWLSSSVSFSSNLNVIIVIMDEFKVTEKQEMNINMINEALRLRTHRTI